MSKHFAMGFCTAIPSGANPTPIQFAFLSGVTIDFKNEIVTERGQYQFDVVAGVAKRTISGKIDSMEVFGDAIAAITGGTAAAGLVNPVVSEIATIPGTPYQVTVAQSANFSANYGVKDLTSNAWMTRVASSPTTGQYSVSAGVYTFAAADTTHKVEIQYTHTVATSKTVALTNSAQTILTPQQLVAYTPSVSSKAFGVKLYAVVFPGLSFALKQGSFTAQSVEFMALEDGSSGRLVADFYAGE